MLMMSLSLSSPLKHMMRLELNLIVRWHTASSQQPPQQVEGSKPWLWYHASSPPAARRGRASLRHSRCEISNGDWARGERMSRCRGRKALETDPTLSKVSEFTGTSMNECAPHRPTSFVIPPPPLFSLPSPVLVPSPHLALWFLLSPSVSQNITVGQKSSGWRLQGCIMRINELEVNMQAVCCLRLYIPVSP